MKMLGVFFGQYIEVQGYILYDLVTVAWIKYCQKEFVRYPPLQLIYAYFEGLSDSTVKMQGICIIHCKLLL